MVREILLLKSVQEEDFEFTESDLEVILLPILV